MTVTKLYEKLNDMIPSSLSCEWDNDGIMCLPDPEKEAERVLFALDVTTEVAEYAVSNGFDVIISHHPMIFRPIKSLTDKKLVYLIKNSIAVFSFHTRLDKLEGGVNTALSELFELKNISRFGEDDLGVIGELDCAVTPLELAAMVKKKLGCPSVNCVLADKPCERIAIVGGSGDDYISSSLENGADAYISGELGYNDMTDAEALGITLIAAGHYYTENPVLNKLEDMVKSIDSSVITEKVECNLIKTL